MFKAVTETIIQRIPITMEYPVIFTRGVFHPDNLTMVSTLSLRETARRHRIVVIIDSGVAATRPALAAEIEGYAARHADRVELAASPWTIPGGEAGKSAAVLDQIVARLAALRVDRHSFIVAIGGGATLDVVGFAAATLHRGVRLVRLPTTVLAQNDAGVGVKNGINAFGAKNVLGTFTTPFAVIADSEFLATLAPRDRAAGMAEAVKVALVRDAAYFRWLAEHADRLASFDSGAVEHLVKRCAELHLAHIATGGDPFEQGNARPLDFGHWAAHKLEILTDHALRHGEAVAIGMALDSRYSVEAGLLGEAELAQIVELLERLGLPVWHPALDDPRLLGGLAEFREHLGGELTITLLAAIGRGIETRDIREDVMRRAIRRITSDRRAA